MKALMILPSYNEKGNITQLIEALLGQHDFLDVLVVDDNSPDGTSPHVKSWIAESGLEDRVFLVTRQAKSGRGNAVRHGLEWGMQAGRYDYFAEMDCDFSHPVSGVETGFDLLQKGDADVVLGSRYPKGKVDGWPLKRKVFSFLANLLARLLINPRIHDYTNGFRFYSKSAVELLLKHKQQHFGYIYLSESLSLFLRNKMRIKSFPIHFINRSIGNSNTSLKEVVDSLRAIFQIAWQHHRKL